MAAEQNSTMGKAKKAPPRGGGGFDEYKKAIEDMDSEEVLRLGQENHAIRFPNDENSSDEESFTDRQRRLSKTASRRMNEFIEKRRKVINEEKWTNLEGEQYMELLDIIDRQIDMRPDVNTDEYLQNLLQVISRFRLFTPSWFTSSYSPLKMYPSVGQRFAILQEKIYNLLSDQAKSTASNYAYGIKRKSKKSKRKSKKSKRKTKKSKRKSKKSKRKSLRR